jgi:hypothetical protein
VGVGRRYGSEGRKYVSIDVSVRWPKERNRKKETEGEDRRGKKEGGR